MGSERARSLLSFEMFEYFAGDWRASAPVQRNLKVNTIISPLIDRKRREIIGARSMLDAPQTNSCTRRRRRRRRQFPFQLRGPRFSLIVAARAP